MNNIEKIKQTLLHTADVLYCLVEKQNAIGPAAPLDSVGETVASVEARSGVSLDLMMPHIEATGLKIVDDLVMIDPTSNVWSTTIAEGA